MIIMFFQIILVKCWKFVYAKNNLWSKETGMSENDDRIRDERIFEVIEQAREDMRQQVLLRIRSQGSFASVKSSSNRRTDQKRLDDPSPDGTPSRQLYSVSNPSVNSNSISPMRMVSPSLAPRLRSASSTPICLIVLANRIKLS